MKVKEVMNVLERFAPLAFQEDYDNAGLVYGDPDAEVSGILVSLDLTPEVIREAAGKNCGMVISHHPFIFRGLKKIIAGSPEFVIMQEAVKHGMNIYAIHTNLDNSFSGLNLKLCRKLGLKKCRILTPKKGLLYKLVTFCPQAHAERVRDALFGSGAGHIGHYDSCSYNTEGYGTFRASAEANPFVGKVGELHREPEIRIEVIFPGHIQSGVIAALKSSHPYEEVAFDIYPLANEFPLAGSGMYGLLDPPLQAADFLRLVKQVLNIPVIRHSDYDKDKLITNVAVCSGAGSFLLMDALRAGAEAFLTADLKYHDFQQTGDKVLLADIGHYESEQWVKELIYDVLIQKFPTFAISISEMEVNPVKYL